MQQRKYFLTVMTLLLSSVGVASTASAVATSPVRSQMPTHLAPNLPIIRLHFDTPTRASSLPALRIAPALKSQWVQIGPRDVQAIALTTLKPAVVYTISVPQQISCSSQCAFSNFAVRRASVATNVTWEEQLLAQLWYLPVSFTPSTPSADPSLQTAGQFLWRFPKLPMALVSQWRLGSDNVILRGALMNFQNVSHLPTTGVADTATWSALIDAARAGQTNTGTYNYVSVTTTSPETLTLYVAGRVTYRTLVNTGISIAPTARGTYPVYLRYQSQTMSGTNPDGTHYSDPGIPWVSYFNGGDALHGFIRANYGWPQSLGCVEMPFANANFVWPYTPIGTLVSVQ